MRNQEHQSIQNLVFKSRPYEKLLLALQNHNSMEICGFLLGFSERKVGVVTDIKLVRNANSSPFSFAIASYEYSRVLRIARQSSTEIIALFHSHLDGKACLSHMDKVSLAHSEYPWVIGNLIKNSEQNDLLLNAYNYRNGSPTSMMILSEGEGLNM